MMRYSYTHSAYMLPNESHTVEEMGENHDYARWLHHADVVKYKMAELEAAGALPDGLQMRVLWALQESQYTHAYFTLTYLVAMLDLAIDKLPVYVAPKPSRLASLINEFCDGTSR